MRIAFVGAHSTGKSTVFNELKNHNYFKDIGIKFIDSPTRTTITKFNMNGDEENQTRLLYATMQNSFHDHSISDRTVLDVACYTKYLFDSNRITTCHYIYCNQVVKDIMKLYDYIFYFPAEFDIIADGIRSDSEKYRTEIINNFEYFIDKYNIRVIPVKGTVEERTQFILNVLGA